MPKNIGYGTRGKPKAGKSPKAKAKPKSKPKMKPKKKASSHNPGY